MSIHISVYQRGKTYFGFHGRNFDETYEWVRNEQRIAREDVKDRIISVLKIQEKNGRSSPNVTQFLDENGNPESIEEHIKKVKESKI